MSGRPKPRVLATGERIAPKQQQNWDWRAAANFVFGGAGGGLLAFAALATLLGADARLAFLAGMGLIGAGLTCVWFEIGRPWRALNVYRHLATSWMTREAAFAPVAFVAGTAALAGIGGTAAALVAGLAGLGFLYSQACILAADKGIPAWRHPRCRPLVIVTGLVEGAGLLMLSWGLNPAAAGGKALAVVVASFLGGMVLRAMLWRRYRNGLAADGAPEGSLRALAGIDANFIAAGHAAPVLFALAGLYVAPAFLLALAGACAVGGGWLLKATLVRRAAFTQGFALKHLPVRGRGPGGPAVKPGWGGVS